MKRFGLPRLESDGLAWLGVKKLTPQARWEAVQSIQRAESGPSYDTWVRCLLVLTGAVAVGWAVGRWEYMAWAAAYIAVSSAYFALLRRISPPVRSRPYSMLLGLQALGSVIFASLPVAVWLFDVSAIERAFGVVATVGQIMFNLTRRKFPTWNMLVDQVIILGTLCVIGVQAMQIFDTNLEKLLFVFGVAILAVYYVQTHISSVLEHADFLQSRMDTLKEQNDNAAGQITAGVAHDFNNILTVVQGNIELAELTGDTVERREFLEQARQSTRRASDIVAQMMSYVGKSQLHAQPLSLSSVFDDVQPDMMMIAPKSVYLDIHRPAPALTVMADRAKLKTALLHLVRNAGEAMAAQDDGWISVSVDTPSADDLASLSVSVDNAAFVAIRVTDRGPGIQDDIVQRVTEPFFSTKPKGQGSGLGLSMVKGFAKQSGGALVLKNAQPNGLEATLILPAANNDEKSLD